MEKIEMNTDLLNLWADAAFDTASRHGFHDEQYGETYYMGLVLSEVGEIINADRKGKHADLEGYETAIKTTEYHRQAFETYIKDTVEDEFADVVIRLLDFAGASLVTLEYIGEEERDEAFRKAYDYTYSGANGLLPGLLYGVVGLTFRVKEWRNNHGSLSSILASYVEAYDYLFTGSKNAGMLWTYVKLKMVYNMGRPKLNGKKY